MTSRGPLPPPIASGADASDRTPVARWEVPGEGAPAARSEEWLSELFGRHSGAVHAYARRRLDTAEDAEDVVVEVFTTAWRRRAEVPALELPWLYATASNVIAHVLRSDARRTRLGARLATVSSLHIAPVDPGTAVVNAVAAGGVVGAALEDLAESDAELLRLWAWEQLEPAEIAVVLGCSPGTARTRLHRARARLRTALAHRGVSDAELGTAELGTASGGTTPAAAPSDADPAGTAAPPGAGGAKQRSPAPGATSAPRPSDPPSDEEALS